MAHAVAITSSEMNAFLVPQGFKLIPVANTRELVYAKRVSKTISLRVYTSLEADGFSREVGADAIRVVAFTWFKNAPRMVGGSKRVHRVAGWRQNLQKRLDHWQDMIGPACPLCGLPTNIRQPKAGQTWKAFHGCVSYPDCKGSIQIQEESK